MKLTFTKITRALGLLGIGFLAMMPGSSRGQICSASNSWGCGHNYGGNIVEIKISDNAGTLASYSGLACSTTSATSNVLVNASSPIDITAGQNLTLEITGSVDAYGWGYRTRVGIWLDYDRNNSFSAAECIANPSTGPWAAIDATPTKATLKLPCWSATGASTMRFRGFYFYSTVNSSMGCGSTNTYGNIIDVAVNLKVGAPPVANFIVPTGPNYENTTIKFNAANPNNAYNYQWTFSGPDVIPIATTGTVGRASWAPPSPPATFDVKMLVSYCGIKDSISKSVTIVRPKNVPTADFIAKDNLVEIYYNAEMLDLSTDGAYKWSWEATSPTGAAYTSTVQNAQFFLDELGKWDFCLTAENGIGASTKNCKTKYVECTPPSEFYMGITTLGENKKGTIYDHAGPGANYGPNRKTSIDYFKILPCGAKEIRLKFKQIRLTDANDKIRIYDAGQADATKELTPAAGINSTNQATYRNSTFTAKSGAMYLTFESNATGQDSGFIATWDSDLLPPVKPKPSWSTPYNPAAIGTQVEFSNTSSDVQGAPVWDWIVDGNSESGSESFNRVFTSDGTYTVCLAATTCNGTDTFCKTIDIVTPTKPGLLDYTASNVRPDAGKTVDFQITSDYATNFEWNIFPTTYTVMSGALTGTSKKLSLRFDQGGCYTFTLKGWNSAENPAGSTEKKVIKNKYVCALNYCVPLVDLISSDIGINEVTLSRGSTTLINNLSTSGITSYTDYSATQKATLTFGASYTLDVARLTNSNSLNYKAWIDFNVDGDFFDVGEEVMSTGAISGLKATVSFTVPNKSASFEGKTRLRVSSSYGNFTNTPCGVNIVGEFEDYGITLANDGSFPEITLVGKDTLYVERTGTSNGCWDEVAKTTYSASDPTEGDMTSKVVVNSDLDCTIPGIYSIDFNVTDASGNSAAPKRRTVYVVLDRTAPTLTLNGNAVETVEQCGTYNEAGAIATDAVDGNLTTAIVITGSVNTSTVGDYTITYTVSDAQGNTTVKTRTVQVRDTKKPGIYTVGSRIVDNTIIKVQINSVFVDNIYAQDECNGDINIVKTPGFNGPVNTAIRATYPVIYTAEDPNGNLADENGYVINYQVDDYIAPTVALNTEAIIIHDVNTPYVSRDVTVSDNYYPLNKVSVIKTGSVDPYTLGTYTESYTATDESGNSTTVVRTVNVIDRVAPQILAPAMNVCVGTPFWAMSGLVISDNYYSPATLTPLVSVLNHNINIWEAGVYYINYTLTDPSGNKAMMVTRPVFVNYPPNCQNTYLSTANIDLDEAVSVFPNPTSGKVTLSYMIQNSKPVSVEVFNVSGSKVASFNNLKSGLGHAEINMSQFGNGVYMIRLSNDGQTTTKRVVVRN
ncbi:MAG: DUF5011 domain-containing protein [Bacteroidetes bacterium]|nr:DUF5011 domain-containing protein [Bacteroidota bacterium]